MTRQQAFKVAQRNRAMYQQLDLDAMFGRCAEPVGADFGYKHGWYTVGAFSFPDHELAGVPMHCPVQAAFAYL